MTAKIIIFFQSVVQIHEFHVFVISFSQPSASWNTPISKNVEVNEECQLSNGDCTTEKKCGIEY